MAKPYPREFRDDVVRVARNRDPDVSIKDIAADFGISKSCLSTWLFRADRDDGIRSGTTTDELSENRVLRKRLRLLEQENIVITEEAGLVIHTIEDSSSGCTRANVTVGGSVQVRLRGPTT